MSYIWYAWLTTILYGFGVVIAKLSTKRHIANPWLFNFVFMFLTMVMVIPFALMGSFGWPQDWSSMLVLSLTNALSAMLYILSLYRVDVSVLGPFYCLRTPLTVLLGVVLFKEVLTTWQIALIVIIFIAGLFVSIDERMTIKTFFTKDIALVLFAILISTLFNISIKYASRHNGFWEVVFWSNVLGFIFILPTIPLFYSDFKKTKLSKYQGITWSTLICAFGLLCSFHALGNNVSISTAIMSLPFSMVFAIILSVLFPKLLEKHTAKVYVIRLSAAAVMFLAALGLSG